MRNRRRERKHIRRKISLPKIPKKLFILLAIVVGGGVVLISLVKLFTIKSIKCQSQYGPCSDLIQESLQSAVGKYVIAAKREINEKLSGGKVVKSYSVIMHSPSELEVTVVERKPVVAVANETNLEELFIVDIDGFVIGKTNATNLPVVIVKIDNSNEVGKQTTGEILFASKILRSLASTYTVKVVYLELDGISATLPSSLTVLFPKEGDEEVLMGSLSLILSRLNTQDSGLTMKEGSILPKIIDLRFKNPVLR